MNWYMLRREEANQKLRLLHLDTLCRAVSHLANRHNNNNFFLYEVETVCLCFILQDMVFWIKGKLEVEIVDFLIQVKESMVGVMLHFL